jgi:hypothetical protein
MIQLTSGSRIGEYLANVKKSSYTGVEVSLGMKATEMKALILEVELGHAERIWTEFRYQEIGSIFEAAIFAAERYDNKQTPDRTKIPMRVEVSLKNARIILARFNELKAVPSDRSVYERVRKAFGQEIIV